MTGWVLVIDHVDHPMAGRVGEIVGRARISGIYAIRIEGLIHAVPGHMLSKWWVA